MVQLQGSGFGVRGSGACKSLKSVGPQEFFVVLLL